MSDKNQVEGINDASNQEKNSEIEVEEDKENNQKMSIPENPIQNVHNLDNKEIENRLSEFPTNNMYVKDSQYNTNNNFNPGIMSTGHFMQNIDLRCDDHKNKFNIDIQATRFCSKCKVLCCDTCVIDFHNDHINFAKTRIEDYFRNAKLHLDDLRAKVNNSIRFRVNYQEIDKIISNHEKILESYFNRRQNKLEDLKKKIDFILEKDNEIHKKLNENINVFYKDECSNRMNQPLKENEKLLQNIQNFLNEWDNLSKTEKVEVIKSNQIELFEKENSENSEMIKNATEAFKGKSKDIDKKINDILKDLNSSDKFDEFDRIINDIQKNIIQSHEKISKLKYDDLIIQKVENIVNQKNIIPENNNLSYNKNNYIPQNQNQYQNQNNKPFIINDNKGYSSNALNNNMGLQNNNNNFFNNNDNNGFQKDNNSNMNYPKKNTNNLENNVGYSSNQNNNYMFPPNSNKSKNGGNEFQIIKHSQEASQKDDMQKEEYELFIFLKIHSNFLIVFNPSNGFQTLKVTKSNFQNPSESFINFPDNSKYINLDSSVLLTGGYINRTLSNLCFLIIVGKIPNSLEYELSIMPYGKMLEARERHNIIYLKDRKIILVCSGFFNKRSEYSEINVSEWKSAGEMNEVRGNATIAYINNRYVYVIGGYKILDNKTGAYLGNCEYLDFNNLNIGWRQIEFSNMNIQLSAMGVIPISNTHFILCGGFDGTQYKKEVYKVDCTDPSNVSISKMNVVLPGSFIFLHNTFTFMNNFFYNVELSGNAVEFDMNKFEFRCIKSNS